MRRFSGAFLFLKKINKCIGLLGMGALLAAAPTMAQETMPNKDPEPYELGKFQVNTRVEVFLDITCNDNSINQSEDHYYSIAYDKLLKDYPQPGYSTLNINMFTGGANCCNGYYLLTSSDKDSYAAYIEPGDYYLVWQDNRYVISDPYFMYYSPEFATDKIAFNRVNSPRMNRLLVFENKQWRTDKPGEFPDYYKQQLSELADAKDMDPLANAIVKAYYTLMSGQSVEAVRTQFTASPIKEYQAYYPQIFEDITKAINYNPVKNIGCR